MSFYRTKRSEVRYNDKRKSNFSPVPHTRSRSPILSLSDQQRQQNHLQFHNKNCIILNAQKEKLSFVRTSVRVLWLLTVRYTSPVPQIFSPQRKIKGVGGLFGVWMAQRIKHTTEGVKTILASKTKLIINKTNVNIIIILLYSCLFGAWKLKSQSTTSRGVK